MADTGRNLQVGDREEAELNSIVVAVQETQAALIAKAERRADEIVSKAQSEAQALRDQAAQEAEQVRDDAARTAREKETYAKTVVSDAQLQAQAIVADAEKQAEDKLKSSLDEMAELEEKIRRLAKLEADYHGNLQRTATELLQGLEHKN